MLDKLKWRFTRFMYGRYGVDQLYITSGIIFIVVQLLGIFIDIPLLQFLSLILIIWTFYRAFSKNISARRAENQKFLKFTSTVKSKWKLVIERIQNIKTHRYRKCPECNRTLRLPKKRGAHKVRCPECEYLFDVKIRI